MGKGEVEVITYHMCTLCGFTLDHELRQKKMVVLCSYVSARYTKSMMVAWRIMVATINKFSFLKLD